MTRTGSWEHFHTILRWKVVPPVPTPPTSPVLRQTSPGRPRQEGLALLLDIVILWIRKDG